jgi:class 3 adenylate cyclase
MWEVNLFHESKVWRNARNKRTIAFVKILAYVTIILAVQWAIITAIQKIYLLTYSTLITILLGIITLKLIHRNKLITAKALILFTGTSYFLIASIFASGYGIDGGSAHFGFITLALISYFLLYDIKYFREIISATFLLLFYVFHFGYAPFYPLVVLSPEKVDIVHKMDIFLTLLTIYFITRQFVIEITKSEETLTVSADRLEGLLYNMLPKSIAARMRSEGKSFADEYQECSVLIADIVGFTSWSEHHSPNVVVDCLNNIFSAFDDAVEEFKLTKIKTTGDAYMVAAGIPEYRKDHAEVLVTFALKLQQLASQYNDFKFRIGVNSGPLVAGIIGKKIFTYDLWGDTVNTTSRLESNGEIGKVNISGTTYKLVKDKFNCTYRGKVPAKNKGEIDMYFIDGIK